MDYRKLGRTDIKVSALCLGTMTWGEQNSEADGHAQMDYALEHGINFFDTAELYAIPPKPETQGRTEEIIGSWLTSRKSRDKIVLASKVAGRSDQTNWLRANGAYAELSPAQIREAIEASLARLKTDYLDLYQVHWPDRKMRLFGGLGYEHKPQSGIAISETLEVLADLVDEGKVRAVGISNETPWGTMQYLAGSEMRDLPRIASIQNAYNLVNRTFEMGLSEIAHREDVGLLAYSPLAQGYLTGKYRGGALPEGARKTLFNRLQRYETTNADDAMEAYFAIAHRHAISPTHLAMQFVTTRPFVTSNIFGATTMEQLKTNIASLEVVLSDEVLQEIEEVHLTYPNPCP